MIQPVVSEAGLNTAIDTERALLVYFSHEHCNVCKVLKPKIQELITQHYPKFKMLYCDTVNQPEIAAQHAVFAVPTILIWFQGKETFRFSRNIGLAGLEDAIARPYALLFEE